eukprot:CAMPEP_0170577174 /NCGR_PEP_ID=MMETSP0224-20130122/4783_1 /TAXON_ID=285029 /ORGANISM="Togula jolla, Strain CCCM 725" /LENGTH=339 /DNA_ID=CAMNT_0010900061 /DNA_START=44 /DNA_END=1063 /DNA_ORIENTATION=-
MAAAPSSATTPLNPSELSVQMEDLLDAQQVSAKHFEVQTERETEMINAMKTALGQKSQAHCQLDRHQASQILRLMSNGSTAVESNPDSLDSRKLWFDCMMLLDRIQALAPVLLVATSLTTTCIALYSLLRKSNGYNCARCLDPVATLAILERDHLREGDATHLTEFVDEEQFRELLYKREIEIFHAVEGRVISTPSPATWLHMFVWRCNIISRGTLLEPLRLVHELSTADLTALVVKQHIDQKFTPRRIANTCFLVSMIKLGLLPLDILRPDHMCESEWKGLCARLESWTGAVNLKSGLSESHRCQLVQIVEASTCCCLRQLQDDAVVSVPQAHASSTM